MERPVFRPEVLAERERASLGAIVMIRPLGSTAFTLAAAAVAAAILAYLAIGHYAKKASLAGTLVPASGAIRVVAAQPGIVLGRRVREGDRVAAGEELLRLADPRATAEDGSVAAATIALARTRAVQTRRQREEQRAAALGEAEAYRSRIAGLEAERIQLEGELDAIRGRESLARESLARFDELERRGFVSPAQRQQKAEESLDHRARRHAAARARLALDREIAGLRLAAAESQARARAQLAALDAQLAGLEQDLLDRRASAEAVVTAPAAGTVAAVLVESGQAVAGGAGLATLLPEGSPLEAHLFAPSRSVGFIRPGQEVRLRYPAFPYQKFGSQRARVLSVSRSAAAPAEFGFAPPDGSREPLYRVKVGLASQSVTAYGRAEPLQAGMQVEADVMLERRRLIEWLFEPLLGLAERA